MFRAALENGKVWPYGIESIWVPTECIAKGASAASNANRTTHQHWHDHVRHSIGWRVCITRNGCYANENRANDASSRTSSGQVHEPWCTAARRVSHRLKLAFKSGGLHRAEQPMPGKRSFRVVVCRTPKVFTGNDSTLCQWHDSLCLLRYLVAHWSPGSYLLSQSLSYFGFFRWAFPPLQKKAVASYKVSRLSL